VQQIARDVIKKLATRNQNICLKPCGILSAIHEQSADINQGLTVLARRAVE
jgi:S-adenosylmethionine synthetase